MSETLYALAILACPVGMGLMMWFMMRGNSRGNGQADRQGAAKGNQQADWSRPGPGSSQTDAEIARPHAELDQLRAEARDRDAPSGPASRLMAGP